MNTEKPSTVVRPSPLAQAAAVTAARSTRAGLTVRSGVRAGYAIDGECVQKDHDKS